MMDKTRSTEPALKATVVNFYDEGNHSLIAIYNENRYNTMNKEFQKFATLGAGINPLVLDDYSKAVGAAAAPLATYINPHIIEERKLNVASMDVFSRLLMDRILYVSGEICDDTANILTAQLLFLASQDRKADISLYVNTPGGVVSSGLAIYDTIQLIEPDVRTICTGMAASMGSVLLAAGTRGKRSALPHSRVMIHQPLGGARGQASDILIAAKEIEKTRRELCQILADHSGQPLETVIADCDRDKWFTAEEAVGYGLIDSVLTRKENDH